MTSAGGANGYGTIFQLSLGLVPNVVPVPAFGNPGSEIVILGTGLRGATSVTFNGTQAKFALVSANYIRATVPSNATTGMIQVVTPSGALLSSEAFQIVGAQ
jgi:hypothetical protein